MSDKILVEIDQDLKELIPGYLENRNKDVEKMKELLANKDYEELKRLGHQIKGNAGSYGFSQMSVYGMNIEDACKNSQYDSIEENIKNIEDYLGKVEITYVEVD